MRNTNAANMLAGMVAACSRAALFPSLNSSAQSAFRLLCARGFAGASKSLSSVYVSNNNAPLRVGLVNYFERHLPSVGFFAPIGGPPALGSKSGVDRHVELVHKVFGFKNDPQLQIGVSEAEALKLIASGKQNEMLDRIYGAYVNYKEGKDAVVVDGPGYLLGGTELDAAIAAALSSPVLLNINGNDRMSVADYYNQAMLKRQVFLDHRCDVLGVVINQLPRHSAALMTSQLRERFEAGGIPFAGAIPKDTLLGSVRLDEVQASLGASLLFGHSAMLDKEFSDVIIASQRIEELLEMLEERQYTNPLIVTSQDRLDIVLGLLAAQVSIKGPTVAGVLLTQAGTVMEGRRYAKDTVARIFHGIEGSDTYKGTLLPVLTTNHALFEVVGSLRGQGASILPTSTRKITQCKSLFDRHIDANAVVTGLQKVQPHAMTPKMFQHNLKAMCLKNPQRIVLPESTDKRILSAAAEVTQRGLARVTLLGDPALVGAEAKKLGLDLAGVEVINPKTFDKVDRYVDALIAARGKKAPSRETALEQVKNDINMFGVLMVHVGDADGMVSGAIHTTADTIRPAMQVLKVPGGGTTLVSSIFFMCLPDKVLVYGDCAVNPSPGPAELANIATVSADTAAAFGIEPRVAMLSYSTLGSGAGPDVQKVTEAVALARAARPDLNIEGPLQYDAAIDPKVAAVKIKKGSEVAGKATVFVFPDLNTGNNTYKAVQQATGAIAMGPVMQGLGKPVNDLSRGCTVADIVNTICVTSIQALGVKARATKAAEAK